MRSVLVTIDGPDQSVDCEAPGDATLSEVMPLLVEVCGATRASDWALGPAGGQPYADDQSLIASGAVDGMRLLLRERAVWSVETFPPGAALPEDVRPSAATGGIGIRWNRDGVL